MNGSFNQTSTSNEPFYVILDNLLEANRCIAIVWDIEDIQNVRPDLNDDHAWQVLKECDRSYSSECGITWDLIDSTAERLFPETAATAETLEK